MRDSEQQAGVVFTADAKVCIAEMLAEADVQPLEAGLPAASDADFRGREEHCRRGAGQPTRVGLAGLAATPMQGSWSR
ncbi:MAG TPA: hypothetical protein VKV34_00200 [Thermoleophilia bacterium]|nr:hypothetical protein [Thermoleophilia bacterium]